MGNRQSYERSTRNNIYRKSHTIFLKKIIKFKRVQIIIAIKREKSLNQGETKEKTKRLKRRVVGMDAGTV